MDAVAAERGDGSVVLPYWHPRFSSRLGLHRLAQMPGGHEALFTNPRLSAEKLQEAGRD